MLRHHMFGIRKSINACYMRVEYTFENMRIIKGIMLNSIILNTKGNVFFLQYIFDKISGELLKVFGIESLKALTLEDKSMVCELKTGRFKEFAIDFVEGVEIYNRKVGYEHEYERKGG